MNDGEAKAGEFTGEQVAIATPLQVPTQHRVGGGQGGVRVTHGGPTQVVRPGREQHPATAAAVEANERVAVLEAELARVQTENEELRTLAARVESLQEQLEREVDRANAIEAKLTASDAGRVKSEED